jgi:hypothetical protein
MEETPSPYSHWSREEVLKLWDVVADQKGITDWSKVSAFVKTRTPVQCQQKWIRIQKKRRHTRSFKKKRYQLNICKGTKRRKKKSVWIVRGNEKDLSARFEPKEKNSQKLNHQNLHTLKSSKCNIPFWTF